MARKSKGKGKGKKRKGNPVIDAWRKCGKKVGAVPFKKWTAKQKRDARVCVNETLKRSK